MLNKVWICFVAADRQVLVGLPAKDKHGKDDFKVSIFWSVLLERELAGSIVGTRQDLAEALEYALLKEKLNQKLLRLSN
nr:hypothetical protein [Mycoplasmopsis bovis]